MGQRIINKALIIFGRLTGKTIENVINMGSYNYLGFAENNEDFLKTVADKTLQYGVGVCSSRQEVGESGEPPAACAPKLRSKPFLEKQVPDKSHFYHSSACRYPLIGISLKRNVFACVVRGATQEDLALVNDYDVPKKNFFTEVSVIMVRVNHYGQIFNLLRLCRYMHYSLQLNNVKFGCTLASLHSGPVRITVKKVFP